MCCRNRCIACICCTIFTLIFMSIISMFLFWIIISPSSVKFHVTDVSLTQFNLTSNNTLYYNLKVNVTVRNPNNNIIVYYRRITAIAWYKDNDFARLKSQQLGEYKDETSVGIHKDLAVDFDLRIRAKFGSVKSSRFNPPIVQCRRLSVPFISNAKPAPPFSVTKCSTGYFFVNVTVRNPNNNIIVYYRRITAIAWYKDNNFAWVSLAPFDQGHKNTTFLQAVFEGNSVIKLGSQQVGEYKDETSVGIYNDLAVDFDVTIRAKYARFKSSRFNPPVVQCRRLRVPLISNGKSAPPFRVTKCSTGYFFADRDANDA
ncbi:NDR1/HIN1-like protein 3, partial [Mucuna pruriens]